MKDLFKKAGESLDSAVEKAKEKVSDVLPDGGGTKFQVELFTSGKALQERLASLQELYKSVDVQALASEGGTLTAVIKVEN